MSVAGYIVKKISSQGYREEIFYGAASVFYKIKSRAAGNRDSRSTMQNRPKSISSSDFILISQPPLLHSLDNWPHGLAQITERVFHPGRHLRVNCTGNNPILLQRAKAVRQYLLTDARQTVKELRRLVFKKHKEEIHNGTEKFVWLESESGRKGCFRLRLGLRRR